MLTSNNATLCRRNRRPARQKWGLERNHPLLAALKSLTEDLALSVSAGDVILLQGNWYVTHAGLLRIAKRNRCSGMKVQFIRELSDPAARRFAFEATVFKSKACQGFVGYGDADPSNVSALVQSAELRVAETRAINRALGHPIRGLGSLLQRRHLLSVAVQDRHAEDHHTAATIHSDCRAGSLPGL